MQPLLTVSLSAAFLGQRLEARDYGAMAVILAGVACVIAAKLAEDRRRCCLGRAPGPLPILAVSSP